MHIFGKVVLWSMVVLFLPGAVLLTTMTLDIWSKWQSEITQRQERLAASEVQLSQARVKVNELEGQLQQKTFAWGEMWQAPQSQPLPGGNGIQLGVGTSSGLGRTAQQQAQTPRVYAFSDNGGTSTYIGELELVQIDQDRAAGQLLRRPYPGEAQNWPRGNYHVRDTLPPNWLSTVADLESQTVITATKLSLQKAQEEIMTGQLAASQAALDQRLAELNGDGEAPAGASKQVLDGLVQTLRNLETERAAILDDVHTLRVKLVKDYLSLESTLAQNRDIVEKKTVDVSAPGPKVVEAARDASNTSGRE